MMRSFRFSISFVFVVFAGLSLHGQNDVENLIVETYYISDANDATDADGGTLAEGSITYRVFLDLAPNVELTQIFSNPNHTWLIESTGLIWNNIDRGETLGNQIGDNRLDENTVALDSYITFGAAADAHFALPKELDTDGSIIGGENNDGGSESIDGGLLVNSVPEMGLTLTQADGLISVDEALIPVLNSSLLVNLNEVFQDQVNGNSYSTNSETLQVPDGVSGVTDQNIILIAQITTMGELTFNFNVQVRNAAGVLVSYVAQNPQVNEVVSPFLSFPPECGCTDPDFLEFDPAAPCDDGSCQTLIVFGCADVNACNYDADANFNVPELCCYGIDDCNNLDWTVICPTLGVDDTHGEMDFKMYPNPTRGEVWLEIISAESIDAEVLIYNLQGKMVRRETLFIYQGKHEVQLRIENLPQGIYLVQIVNEFIRRASLLVKN
jgi:hypothetical protein